MAHVIIPDITPRIEYAVGGTPQTGFAVPFPFFAAADLAVWVNGAAAALSSTPVGSLQFSVSGLAAEGGFQSGTITLGAAVSSAVVLIERRTKAERVTDFPSGPVLNIAALNTELDRLFALLQQAARDQGRSITVPVTEAFSGLLPEASVRAGKFLTFDGAGAISMTASQPAGPGVAEAYWWGGTATGTANAQAITVAGAPAAYANGQRFIFLAQGANTGAATLAVNALGARPITKGNGTVALAAGDIPAAGAVISVVYETGGGGRFRLLNVPTSAPDLTAFARRDTAQTFTANQTIAATAAGTLLELRSTDDGAAAAGLLLHRQSPTPAANDELMDITIAGRDDASTFRSFAVLRGLLRNPAAAVAEGELVALVRLAGALTQALAIRNGLVLGGATGGFQGTGTINATGYFINGTAAAQVLRWQSPNITPVLGGPFTFTHGLGGVPSALFGEIECITADAGYTPGQVVEYNAFSDADNQAGGVGVAVRKSTTEIIGRWGNAGGFLQILDAATGADTILTPARWAFRITAVRFA
ncbi:MAG: hypothetical protein MUC89_17515 [Acetobacteraceae bacterium]|jgi:hypothetical protein|nr:hypothetical protein [Acetobacteraceae bacterium]